MSATDTTDLPWPEHIKKPEFFEENPEACQEYLRQRKELGDRFNLYWDALRYWVLSDGRQETKPQWQDYLADGKPHA